MNIQTSSFPRSFIALVTSSGCTVCPKASKATIDSCTLRLNNLCSLCFRIYISLPIYFQSTGLSLDPTKRLNTIDVTMNFSAHFRAAVGNYLCSFVNFVLLRLPLVINAALVTSLAHRSSSSATIAKLLVAAKSHFWLLVSHFLYYADMLCFPSR